MEPEAPCTRGPLHAGHGPSSLSGTSTYVYSTTTTNSLRLSSNNPNAIPVLPSSVQTAAAFKEIRSFSAIRPGVHTPANRIWTTQSRTIISVQSRDKNNKPPDPHSSILIAPPIWSTRHQSYNLSSILDPNHLQYHRTNINFIHNNVKETHIHLTLRSTHPHLPLPPQRNLLRPPLRRRHPQHRIHTRSPTRRIRLQRRTTALRDRPFSLGPGHHRRGGTKSRYGNDQAAK